MSQPPTILDVVFYRTSAGNEPVRAWLLSLRKEDRKIIDTDIKTVQYGWPLGMPLVRKIEPRLWETRSRTTDGIARILFTVVEHNMVLLHGFVKKSQKLPLTELASAKRRLKNLELDEFTHVEESND
jgi:phage-related protein